MANWPTVRRRVSSVSEPRQILNGSSRSKLPEQAGKIYGSICAILAPKGRLIGPNDFWIAAHAVARDLIPVTNNEREFGRIPGLNIENWAR